MPNYYQYFKNGEPVLLSTLDDEICRKVLNIEPDPERYAPEFEFGVSFVIACCGYTLQQVVDPELKFNDGSPKFSDGARKVAQWLIDNGYSTDAWARIGKH